MSAAIAPIFIGGLSHSGKTELRMILGSHPSICMTRGTRMWDRYYGRFGDLRGSGNFDRCLTAVLQDDRLRVMSPDEGRLRREFRQGPSTYASLFGLIHQHHAERLGKRRWGEQLGWIERYADPIVDTFPSARIIHMVRDPLDRYSEAAARAKNRKPAGALGWQTATWLQSVTLAERNTRRHPENYRVVRFEGLAADPGAVARDLCRFIGEGYVGEMEGVISLLRFDARDARASAAQRARDAAFVDRYARSRRLALGYSGSSVDLSARDRLPFVVQWPINRAAMGASTLLGVRPSKPRVRR